MVGHGPHRSYSRAAIQEVRRIVEGLGSPALDELGLVEALRIRAAQAASRADGAPLTASVDADDLSPLPPAIEQTLYRIATEALTNVVRHAAATRVTIRLACDSAVHCEVVDDGADRGPWVPGVGISAIRERVAELGSTCEVGRDADGVLVRVCLPLVLA